MRRGTENSMGRQLAVFQGLVLGCLVVVRSCSFSLLEQLRVMYFLLYSFSIAVCGTGMFEVILDR